MMTLAHTDQDNPELARMSLIYFDCLETILGNHVLIIILLGVGAQDLKVQVIVINQQDGQLGIILWFHL